MGDGMSKIGENDRQMGNPQMRPSDLKGADAAILTVSEVAYKVSRFGGKKYVVMTREIPERELWLNKTGLNAMCAHYGDETDDWVGKKFPVRAVFTNVQGTQRHVVQVAQDWDTVMKGKKGRK